MLGKKPGPGQVLLVLRGPSSGEETLFAQDDDMEGDGAQCCQTEGGEIATHLRAGARGCDTREEVERVAGYREWPGGYNLTRLAPADVQR